MGELNAAALKKLSQTEGRHRVDDGLYLVVREGRQPAWVFRYVAMGGQRRDMVLGSFGVLSLPDARTEAVRWQRERQAGRDPIEVRKGTKEAAVQAARKAVSLRECAQQHHALLAQTWKNDKHSAQWLSSLEHLGGLLDLQITDVTSAALLEKLEVLNKEHHETATRIRQRVEAIYDRAIISQLVTVNPASPLRRALRAPAKKTHFASMPFAEIPAFVRRLKDCDAGQTTRLGFEWLILSASRTNEVQFATWSQLNADRTIWTIPAEQMKAGAKHDVVVTDRMRRILEAMEPYRGDGWDWIFPSPQSRRNPLSNGAFLAVVRRMGLIGKATPHGMRASFSTWAYENTTFRSEIVEAALAHNESNAVKAAYNRATYWAHRVELANEWSRFCLSET